MLAAVVPVEPDPGEVAGDAFVEDRLLALDRRPVVVLGFAALRDVCRRQLLGIADDDDLPAARHGADCVPDGHLGGFVEDHDVEGLGVGRQVLRDRQRAHHHAGRELRQHCRDFAEQLAEREVAHLLGDLAGEGSPFGVGPEARETRDAASDAGEHDLL